MADPVKLSKQDVARALVRHHFAPCKTVPEAFRRLGSVQFDPIAPVGCNHDLVLQSRIADYKVGDWQQYAYKKRLIYDGWDKQASLVPYEGWAWRRIFHKLHMGYCQRIFEEHPYAVDAILKEIEQRGPLLPRECEFQERKEEWKGHWHGPNLSKQTLRALWHAGLVMTSGRKNGHHIYDLTERVVPPKYYNAPPIEDEDALNRMIHERHKAMGVLRPSAPYEVWSNQYAPVRERGINALLDRDEIVAVEIEGMRAHATPAFLNLLDQQSLPTRVRFVAPLDQLVWDRKMVEHVFGFDYIWEIYTPEVKRKWGYYVLPVLYGNRLVAKVEFNCRKGVLEIRQWHTDIPKLPAGFFPEFESALCRFMGYCGAARIEAGAHIEPKVRGIAMAIGSNL